nr:class I tRNA ligase family protein [Mycoplasmopsis bovis]
MLKRYYPTNLLVTGYDIIFFWVVRMYFFSLEFTNKKPFETVLLQWTGSWWTKPQNV